MTKLTIQHNWNSYSWIGDKWGEQKITNLWVNLQWTVWIHYDLDNFSGIYDETFHTPEQLVKLWYMELQPQEEKTEGKHPMIKCIRSDVLRAELERRIKWCEECDAEPVEYNSLLKLRDLLNELETQPLSQVPIEKLPELNLKWDTEYQRDTAMIDQFNIITATVNAIIERINNK